MYPEICKIGPFTIYSYGLMLMVAFVIASMLACARAKREDLNPDTIFNFLFIAFIFGIMGSRIFYVIENASYYIKNPLEIFMLQYGGLSWYGGLISGFIAAVVYLKKKQLFIYKTLDLIIPFLALAQAIGRIGCLLNGCCYGKPSNFGIYFKAHGQILIPTQLYSSLALLLIFIILRFIQDKPHREGRVFFAYLLLYSLFRFFIEFLRQDNPIVLYGLTLFQIISIAVFILALVKLALIKKSNNKA